MSGGRINQKRRTREAIVRACRDLIEAEGEVTMPAVARVALVSEATAYRYFPDLVSLLGEATRTSWPDPALALAPIAHSPDPAARVAYATEVLMRHVTAYQRGVRATIATTINRPHLVADVRPGYRFALIDVALEPLRRPDASVDPETLEQLRRALAVIVSAEALFTLTDLCGLPTDEAIASAAQTAAAVTRATLGR